MEYCSESTVSDERTHWVLRQTQWLLRETRWVRVYTQIIGWKELTEFAPRNSVSPEKLTEFGVWNRTLRNRIRPVSDFLGRGFTVCFGIPLTIQRDHSGRMWKGSKKSRNGFPGPGGPGGQQSQKRVQNELKSLEKVNFQKTFRYLWRFYSYSWLFRGFFRGFFVALICLEKQCSGLFRGFFVAFSWPFRFVQNLRVLALEQSSEILNSFLTLFWLFCPPGAGGPENPFRELFFGLSHIRPEWPLWMVKGIPRYVSRSPEFPPPPLPLSDKGGPTPVGMVNNFKRFLPQAVLLVVAHDCGYPLSCYTCRSWFPGFYWISGFFLFCSWPTRSQPLIKTTPFFLFFLALRPWAALSSKTLTSLNKESLVRFFLSDNSIWGLSCTRLRVPLVALHVSRYTCRSWFPGF